MNVELETVRARSRESRATGRRAIGRSPRCRLRASRAAPDRRDAPTPPGKPAVRTVSGVAGGVPCVRRSQIADDRVAVLAEVERMSDGDTHAAIVRRMPRRRSAATVGLDGARGQRRQAASSGWRDRVRSDPRTRRTPRVSRRAWDMSLRRCWPAWLVAYSLNGFFVYLAVLDVLDVRPRTALTATYYGLVCVALLATAWHRRSVAIARVLPRQRTVAGVAFVGAAAMLSLWFVLNTALMSDGTLPRALRGCSSSGVSRRPWSPPRSAAPTCPKSPGADRPSHSGSWRSRSSPSPESAPTASDLVRSRNSIPSRPV